MSNTCIVIYIHIFHRSQYLFPPMPWQHSLATLPHTKVHLWEAQLCKSLVGEKNIYLLGWGSKLHLFALLLKIWSWHFMSLFQSVFCNIFLGCASSLWRERNWWHGCRQLLPPKTSLWEKRVGQAYLTKVVASILKAVMKRFQTYL